MIVRVRILTLLAFAPLLVCAHPGGVDSEGCHFDAKRNNKHCHATIDWLARERAPRAGEEGVFYGPLVRVMDGDSFEAKVQGVVMEFRLAEIDAPEYDQPYGREAQRLLERVIGRASLVIAPIDTDRYGRTIAYVWAGDVLLNRALIEHGAAWFNSQFAKSAVLYELEQDARDAKRGLWALPAPQRIEPWVWRASKR